MTDIFQVKGEILKGFPSHLHFAPVMKISLMPCDLRKATADSQRETQVAFAPWLCSVSEAPEQNYPLQSLKIVGL